MVLLILVSVVQTPLQFERCFVDCTIVNRSAPCCYCELQTIMKKNGEETRKRSLTLRDRSGGSIEFTMWGEKALDPGDALQGMVQVGGGCSAHLGACACLLAAGSNRFAQACLC